MSDPDMATPQSPPHDMEARLAKVLHDVGAEIERIYTGPRGHYHSSHDRLDELVTEHEALLADAAMKLIEGPA